MDRTGLSGVTEGCGRQTEMEVAGQRADRTGLSRVTEGRGRQTGMEAAGQRSLVVPLRPSGSREREIDVGRSRGSRRSMQGYYLTFII